MWVGKTGVEFGVELGSAEDTERDDIEPEEQGDAGAERAVDLGVVGKAGDVPAEDEGGGEPHDGGDDGAGHNAPPGLFHGGSEVVDESDDDNAGGESDGPPDEQSDGVERSASGGNEVQRYPRGEELAEDHEVSREEEGQERERDEEESAAAALPEAPAVGGEIVGAANAFHKSGEDAGGSNEADDKGTDEGVGGPGVMR